MQSMTLKAKGRFTSVNELSEAPEGALIEADDVDILQDGIIEPRRGLERATTDSFPDTAHRADSLFFYDDKLFAHRGTPYAAATLSYYNAGWIDVGAVSAPTGIKIKTAKASQNVYLTTSLGVKVLDKFDGTLRVAGAFKALDVSAVTTGASGFLDGTNSIAYRLVWGLKDANGTLVLGAPSARGVVKNTNALSTFRDTIVTTTIPTGVTTAWIYQLYGSAQTTAAEPSDDLQLKFEGSPTSAEITAGKVAISDITPDSLRGASLYTNASQEGIANGNERPPLAKDITVFNGCLFFANTVSKNRYFLTLISVGGTLGIVADDTLTIGGVVYTAKASETIASGQFAVATGGTAAQNIKDTAASLIRVINRYASSVVSGFYLSGVDDTPGKMLLEEKNIGGGPFYVLTSRATCWSPSGIPTSGTAQASTNDTFVNGLAWSKPNQPEAVPLVNFVQVGSKDSAIIRIVALQEALFIFKDEGISRLTGFYPNFNVEVLDNSAKILGAETPAILNNRIFCLSDQGVIEVSDGVRVISRPIETDLTSLFGNTLATLTSTAFGLSYESDRKYYLFVPNDISTSPAHAHVYNVFTASWTRHILKKLCGAVDSNRPFFADSDAPRISKERKSYTYRDYADFLVDTAVTAQTGDVVTLSENSDLASVGDLLYQSDELFSIITAVSSTNGTVTVTANPTFNIASAQILKAIPAKVTWAPVTLANPGVQKQLSSATVFFKDDFNGVGYLGFETDLVAVETLVPVQGFGLSVWGLGTFGEEPWGGESSRRAARQWVPRDKQRSSQMVVSWQHAYAYSPWKLQGVSLFGEIGSEKVTR